MAPTPFVILNLDSDNNRDPRENGESADGLGIKQGSGSGNAVHGARLWNNVDDGSIVSSNLLAGQWRGGRSEDLKQRRGSGLSPDPRF